MRVNGGKRASSGWTARRDWRQEFAIGDTACACYPLPFLPLPSPFAGPAHAQEDYDDLLVLHEDLREYMVPAFTNAVVLDSGARVGEAYADTLMTEKLAGLEAFEARLGAMDVESWPRSEQVDFSTVRALLNGYRFNLRCCARGSAIRAFISIR